MRPSRLSSGSDRPGHHHHPLPPFSVTVARSPCACHASPGEASNKAVGLQTVIHSRADGALHVPWMAWEWLVSSCGHRARGRAANDINVAGMCGPPRPDNDIGAAVDYLGHGSCPSPLLTIARLLKARTDLMGPSVGYDYTLRFGLGSKRTAPAKGWSITRLPVHVVPLFLSG